MFLQWTYAKARDPCHLRAKGRKRSGGKDDLPLRHAPGDLSAFSTCGTQAGGTTFSWFDRPRANWNDPR